MSMYLSEIEGLLERARSGACSPDCKLYSKWNKHEPNCRSYDILELCDTLEEVLHGGVIT
jgi:hypothetical protein